MVSVLVNISMNEQQESAARVPELGDFRLGNWSVCQSEGTLCADGQSVRLEPRVMDVLASLAAESGRVVSKEELLEIVWGGSFVEEGALSQAIHSLRKALGDDARQPRYIQTIPKRGYRLIAPIALGEDALPLSPPESGLPLATPLLPSMGSRRVRLLLTAVGFLAAATLWLAWNRLGAERRGLDGGDPADRGTRIVVLPFENIGNPKDTFFADGLTEEITKDLASFPSLQVISRTSAMRYKETRKPLPEIGRELRVDYVLEGTVRWNTEPGERARVRITPQLIRVEDDTHVWAEAFEREVEDIFKVQAEISRRVIGQLGITLIPEDKRSLRRPPTEDLEAYQSYLRGMELRNQPFYSEKHVRIAVPMFERAVELDPGFADAWAELSQTHSYLAFNADPSPGRVEKARQALDRAVTLAPDLRSVRLAQAHFAYRCQRDFESAYEQLAALVRLSPNDSEALQSLGFVLRRRGRLAEAIEALQRSFSLDPQTVKLVWAIAETYRALRDYEQADHYYAQAISLAPDQPTYWEERAMNRLAWTGELDEARAVVEEAPIPWHSGLIPVAFQLDFYEREYERALVRLSPERTRELPPQVQGRIAMLAAIAQERLGDRHGALAAAEANRVAFEAWAARFPNDAVYRAYLAVALAQLGRKSQALAQAELAVRQKHQDTFSGPRMVEIQAMVDTILGRRHEAIGRLARLLAMPYQSPISTADLRLNPVWDPLRRDPEFEDLLRQAED